MQSENGLSKSKVLTMTSLNADDLITEQLHARSGISLTCVVSRSDPDSGEQDRIVDSVEHWVPFLVNVELKPASVNAPTGTNNDLHPEVPAPATPVGPRRLSSRKRKAVYTPSSNAGGRSSTTAKLYQARRRARSCTKRPLLETIVMILRVLRRTPIQLSESAADHAPSSVPRPRPLFPRPSPPIS